MATKSVSKENNANNNEGKIFVKDNYEMSRVLQGKSPWGGDDIVYPNIIEMVKQFSKFGIDDSKIYRMFENNLQEFRNFINNGAWSPAVRIEAKAGKDAGMEGPSFLGNIEVMCRFFSFKNEKGENLVKTTMLPFIRKPEMDEDIRIDYGPVLRANDPDANNRLAHDNLIKYGFSSTPVKVRDPQSKKLEDFIVGLDIDKVNDEGIVVKRGSNQIFLKKCDDIKKRIAAKGDTIAGAKLTKDQIDGLVAGEEVLVENMKSKTSNKTFSSYVRFNPCSAQFEFTKDSALEREQAMQNRIAAAEIQSQSNEQEQEQRTSRALRK